MRALRVRISRARRQLNSKGCAAATGCCTTCLCTFHARAHLVDHVALDSPRSLVAAIGSCDNPACHLDLQPASPAPAATAGK
eukprot:6408166-Pyramimonas_sp.AAC.1